MTEHEWLVCTKPEVMLDHLGEKGRIRKLRLFAVASCRHLWHLLSEPERDAVLTAERHADGLVTDDVLEAAHKRACDSPTNTLMRNSVALDNVLEAALLVCYVAPVLAGKDESAFQADMLRHVFSNPFRSYTFPAHLPAPVVQLADALYQGDPCSFALHDALLEAGHPDLANHFEAEGLHPKGCWVLDCVLGKT